MKAQKIEIERSERARFLKITKTFEVEAVAKDGQQISLRLPFDTFFDMLKAAESA